MIRDVVYVVGKDPLHELGGGHSSYVRAHGRAALRAGFVPHLFCASLADGTVDTDFGRVHRVRSRALRLQTGMGSPRYFLLIAQHVRQLARAVEAFLRSQGRGSLIHGFGVWGYAGIAASRRLAAAGLPSMPILSTYTTNEHESRAKVRGLSASHPAVRRAWFRFEDIWVRGVVDRYERAAHLGAKLIVVNYDFVRRLVLAKYPIAEKCRTLPYTTESAFTADADGASAPPAALGRLRPADAPLIVAVSRHDPRKGIDVLLHALATLHGEGTPFRACLVGGGLLLASHRRLAARLGLGDTTAIEGFVPDALAYLRAADVFVLPSLQEGSGSLSLIEALQAGLPVVASGCDGIPEDVVDGRSALLVRPGDAGDLAQALQRLLADATLRRTLGGEARRVFAERFSPAGFADALGATYREVLAR